VIGEAATGARLPGFDGLRAAAALAVVVFHVAAATNTGAGILRHLDVGVHVFFVLSGVLLYRPLARAHLTGSPPPDLLRYLARRAARILPAYWFVLALSAWLFDATSIRSTWDAVVFFGLLQVYSGEHVFGGLVQAWSLCVEIAFYVLLPAYGALVATRRPASRLRAEAVGVALLYGASLVFRGGLFVVDAHIGYAWLPAHLDSFALGIGLAVLLAVRDTSGRLPAWAAAVATVPGLVWAAAGALYLALVMAGLPQALEPVTAPEHFIRQFLASSVAALVVAPVALVGGHRWRGIRLLSTAPAVALGTVSYGVFLWHMTFIEEVLERNGGVLTDELVSTLPVVVLASTAAAVVTYVVVERAALSAAARIRAGRDRAVARRPPVPGPSPAG
jgi:peptidoglycan/LPS O-acetylase OafA/YrhL